MQYGRSIEIYTQIYGGALPEGVRPLDLIGLEAVVAESILWSNIMGTRTENFTPLVSTAFPNLNPAEALNVEYAVKRAASDIARSRITFAKDLIGRLFETENNAKIAYRAIPHKH